MSLVLKIDADISGIDSAIDNVSNSLGSIRTPDLSKIASYFREIATEANQTLGPLKSLGTSLVGPNGLSFGLKKTSEEASKIKKPLNDASAALFSVSQVARDLPFGFIAIQNNLPLVIDSFSKLSKESGGIGNAFKSLGASLIGPAGISFAFGAVVAGVTALVQKYGSLSAAFKDIFGVTATANDVLNKYNSSLDDTIIKTSGEEANLKSLVNIITSANSTRSEQKGAIDAINKQYPGFLANINTEKLQTGQLNSLLASRLQLYIKQIQLEGRREALIKLIGEASLKSEKALSQLKGPDIGFLDALALQGKALLQGFTGVTAGVEVLVNDVKNAGTETNIYAQTLDNVNKELSGVSEQIGGLVNAQKEEQKIIKDNANAQKTASKDRSKALADAKKEQEEFEASVIKGQQAAVKFRIELEKNQAIQNRADEIKRLAEAYKELETATFQQADIDMDQDAKAFNPLKNLGETLLPVEQQADLATRAQQINQVLNNTLFTPLTGLFEGLATEGVSSFKEFGKQILQVIKRIAAQIIASGIIKLLANLILPGAGGVGAAAGAAKGIGGFLKGVVGSVLGIGKVAAPSFSGVSGGAMSMGGQVNVVLRGNDLVGAINRTNTNISRVG